MTYSMRSQRWDICRWSVLLLALGSMLASGGNATGQTTLVPILPIGYFAGISSVAWSDDGLLAVTGSWDCAAILWSARTGKPLHRYLGHSLDVTSAALSGDGKHVWTGSRDGTTRLWDAVSGKELCLLLTFDTGKDWLAVTPDGYFDGSEGGAAVMAWREPGTFKVYDDDATRKRFHRPGLLATLLKGARPQP